jgi:hypothetical protein
LGLGSKRHLQCSLGRLHDDELGNELLPQWGVVWQSQLSRILGSTDALGALQDEDFATSFATQKALGSGAHPGFLYGRNERGPQYFHEWVNWYLQGNPTLPKLVL